MFPQPAGIRLGWLRAPIKRSGLICSNLPKLGDAAPSLGSEVFFSFILATNKDGGVAQKIHLIQACSQPSKPLFTKEKGPKRKSGTFPGCG
jgi:hypothetical protein